MTTRPDLPSLDGAKALAVALRKARAGDAPITHSEALEVVARSHGYRDWNTFRAALADRPALCPVSEGARVSGRYLGQAFEGEVLKAAPTDRDGRWRVVVQFDDPVDVVRFESFSALRQRVACHLDRAGRTTETTSDGTPHLALHL